MLPASPANYRLSAYSLFCGAFNVAYNRLSELQDKVGRDLAAQTAKLTETATSTSQKLLDLNAKFAEEHLKGFEQDGKYATATIQQAQQQLQLVETAVLNVRYTK